MRRIHHLADGFVDGSLATVPMSAFMLLAQRVGAMGRQPPARIMDAGLDAAGARDVPSPVADALSTAMHFGFGGVAGALFSAWARRGPALSPRAARRLARGTDRRLRTAAQGVAFGSLVWATSYMGWVPALHIMPPAHRDRPGRPWSMVIAHWIYGATLGWRTAARGV